MAKAKGSEVVAAFKKAAAWGTEVECGAGTGVLILPPSIKKTRPELIDDSLGLYYPKASDTGEITVDGVSIPAYLRYDSLDLLLAMVMGATGGAPIQQGATAAYKQVFTLAENNDGKFLSAAFNKKVYVESLPALKLVGFDIEGEVGKPLKIILMGIANDKLVASAVNTLATMANVTIGETANRALYSQGTIRMNAQGGAALGSGDKIYPNSFKLSYKRAMRGDYGTSAGFDTIDEPANDGPPECTLTLNFPSDTANTLFTDHDAGNRKKADLHFIGAQIAAPYNREFKIELPNLKIRDSDAPIETGIIKTAAEYYALGCDIAPTGMTGITLPFKITAINQKTTDVLA